MLASAFRRRSRVRGGDGPRVWILRRSRAWPRWRRGARCDTPRRRPTHRHRQFLATRQQGRGAGLGRPAEQPHDPDREGGHVDPHGDLQGNAGRRGREGYVERRPWRHRTCSFGAFEQRHLHADRDHRRPRDTDGPRRRTNAHTFDPRQDHRDAERSELELGRRGLPDRVERVAAEQRRRGRRGRWRGAGREGHQRRSAGGAGQPGC